MDSQQSESAGGARDPRRRLPTLSRESMLLLLTMAAGSVDAISYLGLGHVFTAMMTGNTALLGLAVGQGQVLAALRNILALAGFAGGVAIGAAIVHRDPRQGDWPPVVTKALALEALLLALFASIWHLTGPGRAGIVVSVMIVLTAVAMGVQSAAVQRLGVPGVMTTYITGTLTNLMVDVARWLRPADRAVAVPAAAGPAGRSGGPAPPWERRLGLLAAVFLVYAFGALAGSFLRNPTLSFVTLLPFAAVALVIGNATARRWSREEDVPKSSWSAGS